ncbi:MAG: hypothetical protein ACREKL_07115 [Chthoniobacterales bacterium]
MSHDDSHSHDDPHQHGNAVDLPTPTPWPIITAFGLTLVFFGLVTDYWVSAAGLLVALFGAIGWFTDVFPHPKHEAVPFVPEAERVKPICRERREVSHLHVGEQGHREHLVPGAVHPYSAGILGGLVGALAMAIVACAWGIVFQGSPWLPINLLAAVGDPGLAGQTFEQLKVFSFLGLIIAIVVHITTSIMVGLLYTVLLPMLPAKREWLYGGIITPVIWSLLIWASMRFISPMMGQYINWFAFVVSQVVFGMVCGYIVYKSTKVAVQQSWPMSARLGVEAQRPNGTNKES